MWNDHYPKFHEYNDMIIFALTITNAPIMNSDNKNDIQRKLKAFNKITGLIKYSTETQYKEEYQKQLHRKHGWKNA